MTLMHTCIRNGSHPSNNVKIISIPRHGMEFKNGLRQQSHSCSFHNTYTIQHMNLQDVERVLFIRVKIEILSEFQYLYTCEKLCSIVGNWIQIGWNYISMYYYTMALIWLYWYQTSANPIWMSPYFTGLSDDTWSKKFPICFQCWHLWLNS